MAQVIETALFTRHPARRHSDARTE